MDRLTNLNSKVGLKSPHYINTVNVRGINSCVVEFILNQSKQPTDYFRLFEESPKGVICRKKSKFGIFRKTNVLGRRRIHSTAFICGKESSRIEAKKLKLKETSVLESQLLILKENLKTKKCCDNLIIILTNLTFLKNCYSQIYYNLQNNAFNNKSKNFLKHKEILFLKQLAKKLEHIFCNQQLSYNTRNFFFKKNMSKLLPIEHKIVKKGLQLLLTFVFSHLENFFLVGSNKTKNCYTTLQYLKSNFYQFNWFIKINIKQKLNKNVSDQLIKQLKDIIKDRSFIKCLEMYLDYFSSKNFVSEDIAKKDEYVNFFFNIYMNTFDKWIKNFITVKYSQINNKNSQKFCKTEEKFKAFYFRCDEEILLGITSGKTSSKIIKESFYFYLKKKLNVLFDFKSIIFSNVNSDKIIALGHCLTVKNKRQVYCKAPLKNIVNKLKKEGFIGKNNLPIKNNRYLNANLWHIIYVFKTLEKTILNYYKLADNFKILSVKLHHILKYSCALTISSKMNLNSLRKTFKKYGKNLTVKVNGKKISYNTYISNKQTNRMSF